MSTFIECNNCGEVRDVEAKSVTLPYYCNECVAADQFQKDITPKSVEVAIKRLDEYPTLTELVSKEELHDSYFHDDNATVENTTLLIQDLEAQIVEQKELNGKANELLNDMSTQLTEDAAELGERDRRIQADTELIADLQSQLNDALAKNRTLAEITTTMGIKGFNQERHFIKFANNMLGLAGEWDAERERLTNDLQDETNKRLIQQQIAENSDRIAGLTQEALDQANEELTEMTNLKEYYKKKSLYYRDRMSLFISTKHRLLNRGLISRILNREE